jgi:hypothetical protein
VSHGTCNYIYMYIYIYIYVYLYVRIYVYAVANNIVLHVTFIFMVLWHDFYNLVFKIKLKLCTRIASEWNTSQWKMLGACLVYIDPYTTDVCQYFVFMFIIARRTRGRRRKPFFEHWETESLLHYDCRPMWILRIIVDFNIEGCWYAPI